MGLEAGVVHLIRIDAGQVSRFAAELGDLISLQNRLVLVLICCCTDQLEDLRVERLVAAEAPDRIHVSYMSLVFEFNLMSPSPSRLMYVM